MSLSLHSQEEQRKEWCERRSKEQRPSASCDGFFVFSLLSAMAPMRASFVMFLPCSTSGIFIRSLPLLLPLHKLSHRSWYHAKYPTRSNLLHR